MKNSQIKKLARALSVNKTIPITERGATELAKEIAPHLCTTETDIALMEMALRSIQILQPFAPIEEQILANSPIKLLTDRLQP